MDKIPQLASDALKEIALCDNQEMLETIRIKYLGKSSEITSMMKSLAALDIEQRKIAGAEINLLKNNLQKEIDQKKELLNQQLIHNQLEQDFIDVTLPARNIPAGKIHPISQVIEEMVAIFGTMGFNLVEGPEIEDDYHNFNALNIPAHHPARQMHDTFYLKSEADRLLRTHTSPVQIRTMQSGKPPFRVISSGRVYRYDWDITHTPMFHQIEGLLIDKDIHMGHLRGCMMEMLQKFFGIEDLPVRFRSNFFPFTEPSAEVDIGCIRSKGELTIGKGQDWLEIAGCGMVHPNVLINVGIDPEVYQGFAFGMGLERLAMLKYGIADLRHFFEGDQRWLKHYGFSSFDIPSIVGGLAR